jgi:tetratricopeptide (TPR) repeat protein
MRLRNCRSLLLLLFLGLYAAPRATAQTAPDAGYQARRQQAVALFSQGKRLEALPLIKELVETNPKDDAMLVALAACLIDHAATLTDQEASARERFHAKDLLDRAWKLGNTTPLALNLAELLGQLPASGAIRFSDNPAVEQALRTGEAAFVRRDFDQALQYYAKALELDPGNYSAALFTGNTYDRKKDFAKAGEWYQRAMQIDPNVETAYRYCADMLAKEGDMGKARAMLIHAAVAEPYNRIVWRELNAWAALNHSRINEVYIGVPAVPKDSGDANQPSAAVSIVWQTYRSVRDHWQQGGGFKKRFPEEKEYRHTLAEESEALIAAAKVLQKLQEDKKNAELRGDAALSLLLKLHNAGVIEPYVLFSLGDAGIARDYSSYRARNRNKLEGYMDEFVVPPVY